MQEEHEERMTTKENQRQNDESNYWKREERYTYSVGVLFMHYVL